MGALINFLAPIFGFLANLIKENSYKLARFTILISVNTAFTIAFIAYLYLLLSAVKWLYEKINFLLSYINNSITDVYLNLGLSLVKALGIWDGLIDAFNFLLGGFVLLLSILVTKYIIHALSHFSKLVLSYIIASLK